MANESLVISVSAAGRMLNCSRQTAYKFCKLGIIPSKRLGTKKIVVPVKALNELLEQWREDDTNVKARIRLELEKKTKRSIGAGKTKEAQEAFALLSQREL